LSLSIPSATEGLFSCLSLKWHSSIEVSAWYHQNKSKQAKTKQSKPSAQSSDGANKAMPKWMVIQAPEEATTGRWAFHSARERQLLAGPLSSSLQWTAAQTQPNLPQSLARRSMLPSLYELLLCNRSK
jgi:hypothetical protein